MIIIINLGMRKWKRLASESSSHSKDWRWGLSPLKTHICTLPRHSCKVILSAPWAGVGVGCLQTEILAPWHQEPPQPVTPAVSPTLSLWQGSADWPMGQIRPATCFYEVVLEHGYARSFMHCFCAPTLT